MFGLFYNQRFMVNVSLNQCVILNYFIYLFFQSLMKYALIHSNCPSYEYE